MPYCIYLRKSRLDNDIDFKTDEDTLTRHEKTLLDIGKKQGLDITKVYKEIVSGETISQRPFMQRLLHEVENNFWEGVLVIEVERLARGDTIDQGIVAQTFKYSSTRIITPTKIYDPNNEFDEEYFEFGLFMSRREYKTINRRLQRGRLASVKEGKYVGNQPPYGYVRKKIVDSKGFTLEPHPEESEVIKEIFNLYTKGEVQPNGSYKRLGISLICKKLNMLNIKPKKSDKWSSSSIRDIINNPVYNGKIRWNYRPAQKQISQGRSFVSRPRTSNDNCTIVKGIHPPIINNKIWTLAQSTISNNYSKPIPSKYILKNPLAGLIICGICGRKMVRRPYKKNIIDDVIMCPSSSCKNISSKLYIVENEIINALKIWLEPYTLDLSKPFDRNTISSKNNVYINTLKKVNLEITTIKSQINKLHDLLEQEIYTKDTFNKRLKLLYDKIKDLEKTKLNIENQIKIEQKNKCNNGFEEMYYKCIVDVYNDTNIAKLKNALLKEVIDKVLYIKTVNSRWAKKPNKFYIDLYPKLPGIQKFKI